MTKYRVEGSVAAGYEPVRDVFEAHFRQGLEANAQCCAYVGSERVVDLWGTAVDDPDYNGDSLQSVFSSTKCLTSIVFATLVDQELIGYEDTVASIWPEFGQNGKSDVSVADVMRHESGLAMMQGRFPPEGLLTENIQRNVIGQFVEQQGLRFPRKESGTVRQYHAVSRGLILNEIFRRVDAEHRTIGQYLRHVIAEPLQADAFIGVRAEEEARISPLVVWSRPYVLWRMLLPEFLAPKVEVSAHSFKKAMTRFAKLPYLPYLPWDDGKPNYFVLDLEHWNNAFIRRGESPSSNGVCSARGLAKIAAVMAHGGELDGFRILSQTAWQAMHGGLSLKMDHLLRDPGWSPTEFSQGGVALYREFEDEPETIRRIRRLRSGYYGWTGLGGSVFQWHPTLKIGFGYTTTLLAWYDNLNMRGGRLQHEVRKCAERQAKRPADNHAPQE
eukprot:maker-scaffold628_size122696-snap-gene-0.33 protein:Tk01144 transcript:maker-scaffold628_size122696-snap-gene-0.33-mRNA-1 annotation:"esterase"